MQSNESIFRLFSIIYHNFLVIYVRHTKRSCLMSRASGLAGTEFLEWRRIGRVKSEAGRRLKVTDRAIKSPARHRHSTDRPERRRFRRRGSPGATTDRRWQTFGKRLFPRLRSIDHYSASGPVRRSSGKDFSLGAMFPGLPLARDRPHLTPHKNSGKASR